MSWHAVDKVDLIDAVLGEDSQFHRTHGFYVHGVPIEAATLPAGWEKRAVKMVTPRKLITRILRLPIAEASRERLVRWVDTTVRSAR